MNLVRYQKPAMLLAGNWSKKGNVSELVMYFLR